MRINYFLRVALPLGLLLAPLLTLAQTGGQVGIGTSTPHASAVLDLTAPNKGLLVPRLDSVARVGIASPATGLLVFQTSPRPGFYYFGGSGKGWLFLADQARSGGDNLGSHTATRNLNLQGNALTGTGSSIGKAVGVGVGADGGLNLGQNTAGNNVYLGYQAGASNTTGTRNQFSGFASGYSNTTGSQNQFSGFNSGYYNTIGIQNLFSGSQSGFFNTTGSQNQFDGIYSGFYNTTGSFNHFSGNQSGFYNTTGSYNTAAGAYSGPAIGSGGITNATALGANVQLTTSNTVVLGNGASVGIGTSAPRGVLDVARAGDTYLVADANSGSGQSVYLPGHLYLAPYGGGGGTAFVQARVPNPTSSTSIGLTLRTTDAGILTDALAISPAGALQSPSLAGTDTRPLLADAGGTVAPAAAGSLLARLVGAQSGTVRIGPKSSNSPVMRISRTFPQPFAAPPGQLLVTVRAENGQINSENFAATTLTITATGFSVNVTRVDAITGSTYSWGQDLQLDWLAIP